MTTARSQLGSAMGSLMLAVELAGPFLSPESVKLRWDDSRGLLVGGPRIP